jgi:hypothetical protein
MKTKKLKTGTWALSCTGKEIWVLEISKETGNALVQYTDGSKAWLALSLITPN